MNKMLTMALAAALLTACASKPIDEIQLMPAPDVYGDGLLNPLPDTNPFDRIPYDGILFATDRSPATKQDREQYYRNDRGQVVRLGLAEIQFGKKEFTWEFARSISMLKSRSDRVPDQNNQRRRVGDHGQHDALLVRRKPDQRG